MAEGGVTDSVRKEWHKLLVNLKTTAEGLLASHSSNVWNIYGGLNRIFNDMDNIMNHRLKVTQGPHGSCLDFWNFVRGLSWLNPTMAPTIEQFHKMTRGGSANRSPNRRMPGRVWLRQSLLDHNLSSQLRVLTGNREYLLQHYEADAFLCQPCYLHAMLQCLHAVEQNKADLLTDINVILLSQSCTRKTHTHQKAASHYRSASLPVNNASEMIRSRNLPGGHLVPMPVKTCQRSKVLKVNLDQAIPVGLSIYHEESATEALRNVLNSSGNRWDEDEIDIGIESEVLNEPLMNMQIIPVDGSAIPKKCTSVTGLGHSHNCQTLHRHPSIRKSRSRTALLLDRILNGENEVVTQCYSSDEALLQSCDAVLTTASDAIHDEPTSKEPVANDIAEHDAPQLHERQTHSHSTNQNTASSDSAHQGATSGKRFSHKRSTSDFGIRTHDKVHSLEQNQSTTSASSLSCSLPNGSERNGAGQRHQLNDGVFLQPSEGQSLRSFLSSQDFHTCAELDKENAHFTLAEGLIAAIEQMKWNQIIRPQRDSDHEEGDSDEEIQQLKQRIRIRRRERLKEKAEDFPTFFVGKSDTLSPPVTTSDTPLSSSPCLSSMSQDSSTSSVEFHDADITEDGSDMQSNNLATISNSGLSLSMASLYSDADIQKSNAKLEKDKERQTLLNDNNTNTLLSAESVAISLLSQFSEKQLPKASELEWLISEQDAPQQLLPLPDSYPISPDDGDQSELNRGAVRTRIRGNLEWAPPRPQIIFNIHPPPRRKVILVRQNYRCAGCGAKVEPGYTRRYRYCEYLGKYFCPCCHSNDVAYIPGRILRRWDFSKYYVSNFARDFLRRIYKDPLFNVMDINEGLYRKVRLLEATVDCRRQLRHLLVFLKTCRLGSRQYERLEKLPAHWMNDIHLYSIAEFVEIKKHDHASKLAAIVKECVAHIAQCPLCQAKGFICEVCRNVNDIIFPFELHKVVQCPACKSCFHKLCYSPDSCPKCARIEARRHLLEKKLSSEENEEDEEATLGIEDERIISR